jgi:PAS domain S-box-containing protein
VNFSLERVTDSAQSLHFAATGPALDALPSGVVSFDDTGAIQYANAPLLSLLGYSETDLAGRHVEMILTVAGRIFFQTHLFPLVRLQNSASEVFLLLRKSDGTDVGALVNATRRETSHGPVVDCVLMPVIERRKYEDALLRAKQQAETANAALVAANVTLEEQQATLEAQQEVLEAQACELEAQSEQLHETNTRLETHATALEAARDAAEEANRAKSQFLAVMSHELRTPLNAIGGYVQLIELGIHGAVTTEQMDALERISRAQRHLLRLINDVLNLSRIEAGRVDYVREEIDVEVLVNDVLPMIEPQLNAGGLTAASRALAGLRVMADREKVQQIMINLLTNAVKFTPPGGSIGIEGRRAGDHAEIHVRDSGIGIPADKLASIFEPFVQVEMEHAKRREGSGLGLAISRDLARGMGGNLTVASEVDVGSTFTLSLPLA